VALWFDLHLTAAGFDAAIADGPVGDGTSCRPVGTEAFVSTSPLRPETCWDQALYYVRAMLPRCTRLRVCVCVPICAGFWQRENGGLAAHVPCWNPGGGGGSVTGDA
jgi:hypothetical protein